MKRKILVLATAAALTTPALAAANPTVYGRAHLSVDWLDNGADAALNVSSNSSRLGFKGSHELDYGLTGIYQIEQTVDLDVRGGSLATRNSFAGIQGGFGMLRLGYFDTPFKVLRGRVDLFGDQVGDARNIVGANAVGENRFRNGIHYRTPVIGGFFADLHYSTNQENVKGTDSNDDDALSIAATYSAGPVYAAVAYEQQSQPAAGVDDDSSVRAAASYTMGALRLTALAQLDTVDDGNSAFGGGARLSLGATGIKGQAYRLSADAADSDATLIAVGADHKLGRNVTAYLNYAMVLNDNNAERVAFGGGHGAKSTPGYGADEGGETTSGLSLGMVYNF